MSEPLYLTQILVSYEDSVRLLKIRDSYDWHQRIWQAFGGRDGAARDFLVRIDHEGRRPSGFDFVSKPSRQNPIVCPSDCFGTEHIPPDYFSHESYRFSLLVNPTKKLRLITPTVPERKTGVGFQSPNART